MNSYQPFFQKDVKLGMAVSLGYLSGSVSVAVGGVQRSLCTGTLQEHAGHAPEAILGSKVEE